MCATRSLGRDDVTLDVLADELDRQQDDARTRLAWAVRCGDEYLVDVMSARLDELAQIAHRHGICGRLAAGGGRR